MKNTIKNMEWKELKNINDTLKKQENIKSVNNMDINLMLMYALDLDYYEVGQLEKIFTMQQNLVIDFYEFMKNEAPDYIKYFVKNNELPTNCVLDIVNCFINAFEVVKDETLFYIGGKQELVDFYLENFADEEYQAAYEKMKDFIDIDKLADDIYYSMYDIGLYSGSYYACPNINVVKK